MVVPLIPLTAIILCGGRSTRMGQDKGSLPIGDESMLDRIVRIVRAIADDVIVVARRDQRVPADVRAALDDARCWFDNKTYDPHELGVRVHHRLVLILPFVKVSVALEIEWTTAPAHPPPGHWSDAPLGSQGLAALLPPRQAKGPKLAAGSAGSSRYWPR